MLFKTYSHLFIFFCFKKNKLQELPETKRLSDETDYKMAKRVRNYLYHSKPSV